MMWEVFGLPVHQWDHVPLADLEGWMRQQVDQVLAEDKAQQDKLNQRMG